MAIKARAGLWLGEITAERHASYIVNVVGWLFVCFGVLALFQARSALGNPSTLAAAVVSALLLAGPAAFLLTRKSQIAAAVLLAINGVLTLLSFAGFIFVVAQQPSSGVYLAILPLFWGPLVWLCWRAFKAASFLRALKLHAARSPPAFT